MSDIFNVGLKLRIAELEQDLIEARDAGGTAYQHRRVIEVEQENAKLNCHIDDLETALAKTREVWAGSDGLIPETCPEGYLQRLLKQTYSIAVKALRGKK